MALIRGTIDVLALKSVSWTAIHAFEISAWLAERSDCKLDIDGTALIQALHRMEEKRLIAGEWGTTSNDRRARYYRITDTGRAHLRAQSARLATDPRYADELLSARRG